MVCIIKIKNSRVVFVVFLVAAVLIFFLLSKSRIIAQENFEDTQNQVVCVTLPTKLSFTIDPFELDGCGQIYSDKYIIENLGVSDVVVDFTDISLSFTNESDFEAREQPFDDGILSDLKTIYLALDFGRSDIPAAVLTDSINENRYSIPIKSSWTTPNIEETSLQLSFSGMVNAPLKSEWQQGDVKIMLSYSLSLLDLSSPSAIGIISPAAISSPSSVGIIYPDPITPTPNTDPFISPSAIQSNGYNFYTD